MFRNATTALVVCLAVGLPPDPSMACQTDCGSEPACWLAAGDCLVRIDRPRQAIELLKPIVARHPDSPALARALARAYLAEGNRVWALRTTLGSLEHNPSDCDTRAWLAWIQLAEGYADLAEPALDHPGCPAAQADRARYSLLRARIALARDDSGRVRAEVAGALAQPSLYPEDRPLLARLRAGLFPALVTPAIARLDLALGYTTNAFAGSPVDLGQAGPPSIQMRWDAAVELRLPGGPNQTPFVELGGRGLWLDAPEASELGYLEPNGRLGLLLAPGLGRLSVAYRFEALLLDQTGDPFYMGHRAEIDWELSRLTLLAGAGWRPFQDGARDRTELDLGAGWSLSPAAWAQLVLTGQARMHLAESDAWSLAGASLLALARLELGPRLTGRLAAGLATDHYYASDGRAGFEAYGIRQARSDLLTRANASLWIPVASDGQFGLEYAFSRRWSTADEPGKDFGYQEHRVELRLRWRLELEPSRQAEAAGPGHVPMDHAIDDGLEGLGDERIRDLLRQDESDRRGACGCS